MLTNNKDVLLVFVEAIRSQTSEYQLVVRAKDGSGCNRTERRYVKGLIQEYHIAS